VPDGAVDILDPPTARADRVVVVIAHARLVAGRGMGRIDAAQEADIGEVGQDHVDRLHRDLREFGADGGRGIVGRGVREPVDGGEDGEALTSHTPAVRV